MICIPYYSVVFKQYNFWDIFLCWDLQCMGVPLECRAAQRAFLPPTLSFGTQHPIPAFFPAGFCPLCIGEFVDTRNQLRFNRLQYAGLLWSRVRDSWRLRDLEREEIRGRRYASYSYWLQFNNSEEPNHVVRVYSRDLETSDTSTSREVEVDLQLPHCLHPTLHSKLDN